MHISSNVVVPAQFAGPSVVDNRSPVLVCCDLMNEIFNIKKKIIFFMFYLEHSEASLEKVVKCSS